MLQENEHEDLILTLQEFVNSFTNEIIPYAVNLNRELIKKFV